MYMGIFFWGGGSNSFLLNCRPDDNGHHPPHLVLLPSKERGGAICQFLEEHCIGEDTPSNSCLQSADDNCWAVPGRWKVDDHQGEIQSRGHPITRWHGEIEYNETNSNS